MEGRSVSIPAPNENLLIIDVGSAITYDFVSENGHFTGGNIAPGLKMRFTILHQMTKKLPQVDADENELIPLFGRYRTIYDVVREGDFICHHEPPFLRVRRVVISTLTASGSACWLGCRQRADPGGVSSLTGGGPAG